MKHETYLSCVRMMAQQNRKKTTTITHLCRHGFSGWRLYRHWRHFHSRGYLRGLRRLFAVRLSNGAHQVYDVYDVYEVHEVYECRRF